MAQTKPPDQNTRPIAPISRGAEDTEGQQVAKRLLKGGGRMALHSTYTQAASHRRPRVVV
eukprot:CAMPEP_0119489246 /NCGR_PEP_ID=MMETSP1344-20130328/14767_1 /TAXON_ID=236787 /ORGANISM="Florenciella parvula, Strain CCMP2471" /LENGTH=59 /DNA_ID=CAMNT_0007524273 /DNA_START=298 /DNA_END=478 /DNA_ORIENTATION=+